MFIDHRIYSFSQPSRVNTPDWEQIRSQYRLVEKGGYFNTASFGAISKSTAAVAQADIDELLYQHPKILDAVSVGIPHDYRGETVKAFVVLRPGETATAEEIIDFCKSKLAIYKVPKIIEFREELPKSAVGKILRKILRDEEVAKREN